MKQFLFGALPPVEKNLIDSADFNVPSLRVSLKSGCNEKCFYCHNEGVKRNSKDIIDTGIIINTVYMLRDFGLKKIKFTGGEPLLFQDISGLFYGIRHISDAGIYLTTNGTLIKKRIKELSPNIINKISVSMDTLDPVKYKLITGKNLLRDVLGGLKLLKKEGYNVEINTLLLKGINSDKTSLREIIDYSAVNGFDLQFIELTENINKTIYRKYYSDPIKTLKKVGFDFMTDNNNDRKFFKLGNIKITLCRAVKDLCDSSSGRCSGLRLLSDGSIKDFFYK